jgi:AcrR family transcriptional regulator
VIYERTALEMFAEFGYPSVTVEQVAVAAGASTRTFFRYFRAKEDILLATPRRQADALIAAVEALAPSDDPVEAIWDLLVGLSRRYPEGVEWLGLWVRASSQAPEVVARAQGERAAVVKVLTDYCGRSLGLDPEYDVRPSVLAAALHAAERAVLAFWEQAPERHDLSELFAEAMDSLGGIRAKSATSTKPRRLSAEPRRMRA